MSKVFVINGHNQAGKDTFVEMIKNIAAKDKKEIINYSTVDFVKRVAIFCGWNGVKDDKNRAFLCQLKDILTEWNNIPFNKCKEIIDHGCAAAIFIHCREPKEIQKIVDYCGAKTILIQRDNIAVCSSNHADMETENYNYNIIIKNNSGLNELQNKAENFYNNYIK